MLFDYNDLINDMKKGKLNTLSNSDKDTLKLMMNEDRKMLQRESRANQKEIENILFGNGKKTSLPKIQKNDKEIKEQLTLISKIKKTL